MPFRTILNGEKQGTTFHKYNANASQITFV